MNIEEKVEQLTELLSELTPAVDSLTASQRNTDDNINKMVNSQAKTNLAMSELRQSNMRLAGAIDKLVNKIDRVDEFEARLKSIENKLD